MAEHPGVEWFQSTWREMASMAEELGLRGQWVALGANGPARDAAGRIVASFEPGELIARLGAPDSVWTDRVVISDAGVDTVVSPPWALHYVRVDERVDEDRRLR